MAAGASEDRARTRRRAARVLQWVALPRIRGGCRVEGPAAPVLAPPIRTRRPATAYQTPRANSHPPPARELPSERTGIDYHTVWLAAARQGKGAGGAAGCQPAGRRARRRPHRARFSCGWPGGTGASRPPPAAATAHLSSVASCSCGGNTTRTAQPQAWKQLREVADCGGRWRRTQGAGTTTSHARPPAAYEAYLGQPRASHRHPMSCAHVQQGSVGRVAVHDIFQSHAAAP
jgi:hypothetical protein